jgi:hypothetical protein
MEAPWVVRKGPARNKPKFQIWIEPIPRVRFAVAVKGNNWWVLDRRKNCLLPNKIRTKVAEALKAKELHSPEACR